MVLPSTSETTHSTMLPNGHRSPLANHVINADTVMTDDESDLSDPAEPPNPSASSSPELKSEAGGNTLNMRSSETLGEDDAMGSDDADYDMETPPLAGRNGTASDHSSSTGSQRSLKRKAPMDDEEWIRNNPELYGLRRSGRARPTRQIVNDTSDEHDSDSDVVGPARKRRRPLSHRSSKRPTPTIDSLDDSDTGTDTYGGARARPSKKQRRRLLQSGANLAPSHAEVRFSTRRAGRVSNYNEDDNDVDDEDESEVMTPSYNNAERDNSIPAIDTVLNHRLKEGIEKASPELNPDEYEFYIKWQQKAHYHATWETHETLVSCGSPRRLKNYIQKVLREDRRIANDPDVTPEDKEKWNLDRERDLDAIADYTKVERVISSGDGEEGTEYLVKWRGLYYDSCTWETDSLISEISQAQIDRYLDRISQLPVSNKTESNPSTRADLTMPIRQQPDYIKQGTLRDFQIKGLHFLAYNWVKDKNVILADEMGLGKTVQTIAFMNWLRHDRQQQGPFIVVVPLSTMPAWAETFDNWTPDINYVVYNGNERARMAIKDHELFVDGNPKRVKFHVLLTTYEYVLSEAAFLSQIKWQFMAVDEAHRLKNRDSHLYAKLLEFKCPSRLLITGTPVQNNLEELSALMDFLNPGLIEVDSNMDLGSDAAVAKLNELTKAIQPYMLRRTKQKVENDLPPKTEKIIRVELSDIQLEYYKNILTKNYKELDKGGTKHSLLNIVMELKKASNHAFLFPSAEEQVLAGTTRRDERLKGLITSSGKMMLLDRLLTKLKKDNHRVLIFSQMVRMLDILGEYMELRGHAFQRLDGTIPSQPRQTAIKHFNEPESTDFCFLLSTRAGGLGINLMTADTVILFDSDWNPQADLQAMARAHRIGQTKPVSVYRLVSKETIEEEILERARNKLMLEFVTIQKGVTDKEATELKDRMARSGGEPSGALDIQRILKRRGQKMFEQSDNQKKLEELDIDAVLENAEEHKTEQPEGLEADGGEDFLKSFDFVDVQLDDLSWDDIIPKDLVAEMKAEEMARENEAYLAKVQEEERPRNKRHVPADEREERQAKRQVRVHVADSEENSDAAPTKHIDPKRPLNEKEYRHLVRAYLRYGSIEEKEEELVKEARLVGRDRDMVKAALKGITDEAVRRLKEDEEKLEALAQREGKTLTKKDRKAVLFDWHGVKRLNAQTIDDRAREMRMLRDVTTQLPDPKSFRIPEATKGAGYSCEWGVREDGMLCVGIARHGYGAWTQIRDDPDLALADKLFLEEHRVDRKQERLGADEDKNAKSPGAVHLVRRADYLLSVLKVKYCHDPAAKKAVENHHRNNKKNGMHVRQQASVSVSASPAPSSNRKVKVESEKDRERDIERDRRDSDRQRHQSHRAGALAPHRDSVERQHTPKPEIRHKHSTDHDDDRPKKHRRTTEHQHHRHRSNEHVSNGVGGIEGHDMLRVVFKPVRESLKLVQNATKEGIPDKRERAQTIRAEFRKIGEFIKTTLDEEDGRASLEARLWDYVQLYWPNKDADGTKLRTMYEKVAAAHEQIRAAEKEVEGERSPDDPAHSSKTPSHVHTYGHHT